MASVIANYTDFKMRLNKKNELFEYAVICGLLRIGDKLNRF